MSNDEAHVTKVTIDPSVLTGPNGANFALEVTRDIIRANRTILGRCAVVPMVQVVVANARELLQEAKPQEQDNPETPRKNPFFVVKYDHI